VPFRVVHRGNQANATPTQARESNPIQPREQHANSAANETGDGVGANPDDWNQQIGDDW
jgi:hypothetical protein